MSTEHTSEHGSDRGADGGAGASQAPVPAVSSPTPIVPGPDWSPEAIARLTGVSSHHRKAYPPEVQALVNKPRQPVYGFQRKPEPK